jgi:isopentenyl phosphate kinase
MDVYVNLLGKEAKHQGLAEKYEAAVKKVSEKLAELQQGTAAGLKKAAMPPPPKETPVTAPVTPAQTPAKAFSGDTVKAIYEVLKEAGAPMNYGDIAVKVINKGVAVKPEHASVVIYNRIKASIDKGEGLFVKTGRGMFSLA